MGYVQHAKQFTPKGYAIIVATILLGLFFAAIVRSESNVRSLFGALLSVSVLVIGLALALGFGQKK